MESSARYPISGGGPGVTLPHPASVTYRLPLPFLTGESAAAIEEINRCIAASRA